jgi:hypothetical protein
MAKPRISEVAALEARQRESKRGGSAGVDLRLDIKHQNEVLLSVGGKWDRRQRVYDPEFPATTRVAVSVHPGQVKTVQWFVAWMCVHAGRRDRPPRMSREELESLLESEEDAGIEHVTQEDEVYSALLAGGRRAGKTWVAVVLCAAYAIQFPDCTIWAVNPTDKDHDEVREYFADLLCADWILHENAEGWELINGSKILLKSAYVGADPDAIKKGQAHLVFLNEGQKQAQRVYVVARGATTDHSGLVMVCANPPVQAKDQPWVADFASAAMSHQQESVYHHFNPLDNPHINRRSLMALKKEVDPRTYRIEVLGEFLPAANSVAYNWMRTVEGNERPRPGVDSAWRDVTRSVLESFEVGAFDYIIGMDFQVHPWMGGPVYKLYCPFDEHPDRDNVVMWGIDELVIEGDELQWCALALERGYDPEQTVIIGDGTGEYQHSRRSSADSPPPEWHGKGSFDMLRMGGFPHILRPDPRIRRNNPHVVDRVRAMTSMIETADSRRRLFLDPEMCPRTSKSIREWPVINGKPSRKHEAAHLGDGASYPIVRLFPRKLRSAKTTVYLEPSSPDTTPQPHSTVRPSESNRPRPVRRSIQGL